MSDFPQSRMRRLRANPVVRDLVRETEISSNDLIYPLFVVSGNNKKLPIDSMPDCYQISIDYLENEIHSISKLGIQAILLFGIPSTKDAVGSSAYADNGVVQTAIKTIKNIMPDLLVITDVCLCQYTDHGHCGIVHRGIIDNDDSLDTIKRIATSHANSGADVVAPSAMMDGQVQAIRSALDGSGFDQIPIMSYASKYTSAFYGPFRDAAQSSPQFGDRETYQMDTSNWRMALREIEMDINEGADIIIVKPALAYLDIIARARDKFPHPIAAYNVSGEYSMVKAAGSMNWLDQQNIIMEILRSIKRAGANCIITYHAKEIALYLNK